MDTPEGWYPDPDDETGQRYWDGQAWTDQRQSTQSAHREPRKVKPRTLAWVVGGIAGVLVALAVVGSFLPKTPATSSAASSLSASATPSHSPSPSPAKTVAPAKWKAAISYVMQVNPASVKIFARLTNVGGTAATPSCFVEVRDASGAYDGYDTITWPHVVGPGKTIVFSWPLVVTNQGAAYVTQKTIKCTDA